MKILKREINEIVDGNGDLIGSKTTPENGSDVVTQANKTTDYNVKVGQQPFRYDMMGRFGFNLMPFMEGEENDDQVEMVNDLAKLMFEKYVNILKYYYKNPNKLKSDYREISKQDFNSQSEEGKEKDFEWAKKIVKTIEPHFEKSFNVPENIDEEFVVEDKLSDKSDDKDLTKKEEPKSVREKKIEKIAGLIGKLEKKDIDRLITLLEMRNKVK